VDANFLISLVSQAVGVAGGLPKAVITVAKVWDEVKRHFGTLFGPPLSDPGSPPLGPNAPPISRRRVTQFLYQLGLTTTAEVERLMAKWPAPKGFTEADRAKLTALLVNLVRGARFHSTHGIHLSSSSYTTAGQLIDQLLAEVEPKRNQGERIDGWELVKFLGMGGFGEVWSAENAYHHERRVYKFFTRDGAAEWLKQEAVTLRAVWRKLGTTDCPNIIEFLDVNIDARPHPYIVLEYAPFGTLEDWILTKPDERLKISVTELIRGIVRGVSDAHKHGITHRDLKPANILLAGSLNEIIPKIADFGLGDVGADAAGGSSAGSQAVLVGTQMYLPPEASNPFADRDYAQDDVFALGVVLFQILTGQLIRPSYDFAQQLEDAGADKRSIKLISKCLAAPIRRFKNACELYDELDMEEPPPGPGEWNMPDGCFDVAGIGREYLEQLPR